MPYETCRFMLDFLPYTGIQEFPGQGMAHECFDDYESAKRRFRQLRQERKIELAAVYGPGRIGAKFKWDVGKGRQKRIERAMRRRSR